MTLFKEKFKIDSHRFKNWDYSSEALYFITIVTKDRKCIFGAVEDKKMILNEHGKIVENELLKSIKIRKNWFFHNWVVMPNHIHLLIEIQNINEILPTTHIVETHSSASTSGISQNVETNFAETHCSAPLQNQSGSEILNESGSNELFINEILPTTHIVETYSSASTSGISPNIETNFAKTHCSAHLQNQSGAKLSRKSNSISSFVAIFKSVTTKQINGLESIWQSNYHDHIVRNYKTFETIYDYIKNNPISWDTDSINSNFQ